MTEKKATKSKGEQSQEAEAAAATGFNSGVVFLPMTSCPSYLTYRRDNADFMNNFFINIIARSFTDIEDFLKAQEEDKDQSSAAKTKAEMLQLKDNWKQ